MIRYYIYTSLVLAFVFATAPSNPVYAQSAPQTFAATIDAAVGYNAWALANNQNSFKRIGGYKVRGSSYLFGGAYNGDVFAKTQVGNKVRIGYDTYQQQLEIYLGGKDPIVKQLNEVDSFTLKADSSDFFKEDLFFLNAQLLDSTQKFFITEILEGKRFSLYKAYQSVLGVVSENYVQSDLRQFDLNYEFYYHDKLKKGLFKIKLSPGYLKKEFNVYLDIKKTLQLENLNRAPQAELTRIFLILNEQVQ